VYYIGQARVGRLAEGQVSPDRGRPCHAAGCVQRLEEQQILIAMVF